MKDMTLWEKLFFLVSAFIICGLCTILVFVARADGAPDYCWIEGYSIAGVPKTYFHLNAHRPWRLDAAMGTFDEFDDAVNAAEKAGCPLHR